MINATYRSADTGNGMIRDPFCHTSVSFLAIGAVVVFACGTHVEAQPVPLQSAVAKEDPRELLVAAGRGDPKAQLHIGLMYLAGDGVDQDADEAATWLHRAADQGDASAQFNLAYIYWEGIRVSGNRSFSRWRRSCSRSAWSRSRSARSARSRRSSDLTSGPIVQGWVA
jgi:TPR repeat protein